MKKFNLILVVIIATILAAILLGETKSEVLSDYNLKPYIFGGIYIPTEKSQDYSFSRIRIGVDANRGSFVGNLDWNAYKSCVHTAFGGFVDTVAGFKSTIIAGWFLNPVWHVWPGPKMLEQTRWPGTTMGFSCLSTGLKVTVQKAGFCLIAANYNSGTSVAVNYGSTWFYWEDIVGFGLNTTINKPDEIAWYPTFTMGFSAYNHHGPMVTEMFRFDLSNNLRAYAQADADMDNDKVSTLAGLTYVYNKNGGFIKIYYDDVSKWIAEFTFAF
ncbi:MAG: hypothetical protein WCT08_03520 [Patescibacteria group bacterium]